MLAPRLTIGIVGAVLAIRRDGAFATVFAQVVVGSRHQIHVTRGVCVIDVDDAWSFWQRRRWRQRRRRRRWIWGRARRWGTWRRCRGHRRSRRLDWKRIDRQLRLVKLEGEPKVKHDPRRAEPIRLAQRGLSVVARARGDDVGVVLAVDDLVDLGQLMPLSASNPRGVGRGRVALMRRDGLRVRRHVG